MSLAPAVETLKALQRKASGIDRKYKRFNLSTL
jgi:hypothetical protein